MALTAKEVDMETQAKTTGIHKDAITPPKK